MLSVAVRHLNSKDESNCVMFEIVEPSTVRIMTVQLNFMTD